MIEAKPENLIGAPLTTNSLDAELPKERH